MPVFRILIAVLMIPAAGPAMIDAEGSFSVDIRVDASASLGPLREIWRFFGADEPNYAYMKDGEKLLAELGSLRPGGIFFRAHNMLNTGPGEAAFKWGSTNAYTEDEEGNPVYDWTITDLIFDTYLERGVRPFVEVGFMPEAMSIAPQPYRHEWRPGFAYSNVFTGWRMPPGDYGRWSELVYLWARHCVERYGAAEVEQWYWETWNEANNQPDGYWGGSAEDFYKLHDITMAAVRRAVPNARVGGPHSAGHGGEFTMNFLEHCLRGRNFATGEIGTPLDFVAFHAKGGPTMVDGHVRMGIASQLRTIDRGFEMVASYPELRATPIVIGESDPEGCAACQGPQLAYRNGTMYSSYTAASFARKHDLADKHGVAFAGALTWAFTFENQPYFAGFRQLASNGVPMAVLNVFRMYALMQGERVATRSSGQIPLDLMLTEGVRGDPDVSALASLDASSGRLAVMVWHYHDDDVSGPDAQVGLQIAGLPIENREARLTHYRIDETHSNAYGEWLRMGSPVAPDEEQYSRLLEAGKLAKLDSVPDVMPVVEGTITLEFLLPRQGVSLIVLE
ncbi:MAG: beta-xylosidase [Opitutaceae bacterium]